MSFIDVYRMWFTNDNGDDVIIHISDRESGEGTSVYTDMYDSNEKPVITFAKLSSANDSETKLNIVRSTRFSFSFVSTTSYNVDFFCEGEDNRWKVEVFLLNALNPPIFTGHLVPDGAKEIFLDHETFEVEFTASDLLQTIGEVPLRKTDGSIPKGKFSLIQYIAWCLERTYLQLPIKVIYSLREETHTGLDDCFFRMVFLDALTFETDINEREDCLTVLEKILLGCFIQQINNEWWIMRVDEMDQMDYRVYSFAYDGTYLTTYTEDFTKLIGITEDIYFTGEDVQVFPSRQVENIKQNFRFETWQELICNITYNRGDLNPTITATLPAGFEAYDPECWLNAKNPHGSSIDTGVAVSGYMRKKIENGYETERVLVLPKLPGVGSVHYWMSEPFEVNAKDKFNFSVDRRLDTDHTGGGTTNDSIFKIRLRGNDNTYWSLVGNPADGKVGSWVQGVGGFPNRSFRWQYQTANEDETNWTTHSIEVDPVPVAGRVEIMLFQTDVYGLVNDTHFANIRIDYIPIRDGVYQLVTGKYHKVYDSTNRKAKVEEEIFISDDEVPNNKGRLLRYDGANYVRIGRVWDFRLSVTGGLGLERFGKWQAFALWNQYNQTIRKFQGNLKGLQTNLGTIPTMIHKYYLTDPSDATDNKVFQMLSFDMDLATCEWSATFANVYDTVLGKDYLSDHEFKYTTK